MSIHTKQIQYYYILFKITLKKLLLFLLKFNDFASNVSKETIPSTVKCPFTIVEFLPFIKKLPWESIGNLCIKIAIRSWNTKVAFLRNTSKHSRWMKMRINKSFSITKLSKFQLIKSIKFLVSCTRIASISKFVSQFLSQSINIRSDCQGKSFAVILLNAKRIARRRFVV